VKTTNDLLALRSDAYVVDDAWEVRLAPQRSGPPVIDLDTAFYKRVGDFEARFAAGAPSLRECSSLDVVGDVAFGAGVVVRGRVRVVGEDGGQRRIDDGTVLDG
jgi:UTP--glucose-1-phosphate uridylyltransferase